MTTCVLYLDMNGKPIPGFPIPMTPSRSEVRTDVNGIARYDPDLVAGTIFWPPGYATAKIIPCPEAPTSSIPEPSQISDDFVPPIGTVSDLRSAESIMMYTGECVTVRQGSGAQTLYRTYNPNTMQGTGQYNDVRYVTTNALFAALGCRPAPAPVPVQITAEGVQKNVDVLSAAVQNISGAVQDILTRLTGLQKAIDDVWANLEAWLVERIVDILLKGLDREVEEKK